MWVCLNTDPFSHFVDSFPCPSSYQSQPAVDMIPISTNKMTYTTSIKHIGDIVFSLCIYCVFYGAYLTSISGVQLSLSEGEGHSKKLSGAWTVPIWIYMIKQGSNCTNMSLHRYLFSDLQKRKQSNNYSVLRGMRMVGENHLFSLFHQPTLIELTESIGKKNHRYKR